MLEEKDHKLQNNVGEEERLETTDTITDSEKTAELAPEAQETELPKTAETKTKAKKNEAVDTPAASAEKPTKVPPKEEIPAEKAEEAIVDAAVDKPSEPKETKATKKQTATPTTTDKSKDSDTPEAESAIVPPAIEKGKEEEEAIEEIEESNAEDAEDEHNHRRHHIPMLDYHSLSMENLVGELQRLVRTEKVQAIKKHVDGIKYEFDHKFQEFLDHKKEEFIGKGGNEIDFRYNSVTKRQFNEVYAEYREKRNQYYKNLEQNLKNNLASRLEIIEELKGLVNVEEDINTTYNNFKDIQRRWRSAGPVPRNNYNDVWRTYHHHIEIFYDFLHLNRELRDLDFKHNLEEKQKIVARAEALVQEEDLGKAFRELQSLHKMWKEDIGPVGKEHREEIWERFSAATKAMHARRQDYYKDLDKVFEKNLETKNEIIAKISEIAGKIANNHRALQQQIKEIEALRESFFKAGKVPQKNNEASWAAFKEAVRNFNRSKNAYYKNLKKGQQENLDKKRELLNLAISLKDSEDWDSVTPKMKQIQRDWKLIGHVPRKYSDKIWNEFKTACNQYFDRLHASKNKAHKGEYENFEKKSACLDKLRAFELSGDKKKDMATLKGFIEEWKTIGHVPYNKKNINVKFNKILDAIFRKLGISRQESELLKYGNKIQQLAKRDNQRAISDERTFIRRKIDESKNEIRQLENNLQFFSSASEDNPLVKNVIDNINRHKEALATWKEKLKKLNIMEHNLHREAEEEEVEEPVASSASSENSHRESEPEEAENTPDTPSEDSHRESEADEAISSNINTEAAQTDKDEASSTSSEEE
ncbi:DUF349 domain-containing protein [Muriicola sp. Z0-33]|uniref:DUF349 domain-containing protein n=1 Tax=Muriicola sp. Z0-33 TaxID=2816957 RepID=UPI002239133C|nr:DUF349 domain-containing protein [Muriicola sp. Z0-33]MCW5515854.1 DUF349 domain-containing protein [Muriicola sp. Z0-33]